jgi:hypothetical protein
MKHFNLSSAHAIHAPKLLYAICLTKKKIPVAVSLSRNTSVCLEGADFYE